MKARTLVIGIILAVLSFIGLFCAGSSETGNALTVVGTLAEGSRPVTCAKVHLVTDGYIPGKEASGNVYTTTTDETGSYRFTRIPPGDYYLNARKDSLNILRGPITLEDDGENDAKDLAADTLKRSATLTITIPEDKDIASVFIEGLTESWEVSSGTVTIEYVPSGSVTVKGLTAMSKSTVPEATTTVEVNPAEEIATVIGNRPPVVVSPTADSYLKITDQNATYSKTVDAYDPESGELTFTLLDGPEGLQLNETTGTISWQLSSDIKETVYKVGVLVSDPDGGSRSIWWNVSFFWSSSSENLPPVFTFPDGDTVTVENGDLDQFTLYLYAFTVADPEGDAVTTYTPEQNVNIYKDSVYTVRYSATDEFGNTSTVLRIFIIETSEKSEPDLPILTFSDTVLTLLKGTEFTLPDYAAFDLKDGNITDRVIVDGSVDTDKPGIYFLEFTVTNIAGYEAAQTVKVIVVEDIAVDTVAPVITLFGPDTIYFDTLTEIDQLFDLYSEPGYSAFDNKDGDLTSNVAVTELQNLSYTTWYCSYSVHDSAGNSGLAFRTIVTNLSVIVEPPVPPIITLSGNNPDTVIVGSRDSYFEPGYSAIDPENGDVTADVTVTGTVDVNTVGKYTLFYYIKDEAANIFSVTRIVYVVANTSDLGSSPVILLTCPDSIFEVIRGGAWIEPGYAATDIIDGDITGEVVVDTSELVTNISQEGIYSVIYTVINSRGIQTQVIRKVRVVDNGIDVTPPVITLSGKNPDTVFLGNSLNYSDPGATAADDRDGDITSDITITDNVNTSSVGKYTVIYRVKDSAGWTATATRTVYVVRNPEITTDLLVVYDVPSPYPIPSFKRTYHTVAVDGEGPDMSGFDSLSLIWDLPTQTLTEMTLTINGESTDLTIGMEHALGQEEPILDPPSAGIANFGTVYYIAISGNEMYWVDRTGKFALIWKEQQ